MKPKQHNKDPDYSTSNLLLSIYQNEQEQKKNKIILILFKVFNNNLSFNFCLCYLELYELIVKLFYDKAVLLISYFF